MKNKIRVVELFAGVGGFRLGLEGWKGKSASSGYKKAFNSPFEIVWSNQWEPLTKTQHASLVYEKRFGKEGHSNEDIATVNVNDIHDHDLLVGGFPCQDYSVATTLKNSKGLIGKKGVLWWSIHKILSEKKKKPEYLILENVDRLLNSPSKQRGRDFAIILKSLDELGYAVEWRIINAADYGMPQRRRRTFIIGYHKKSVIYKNLKKSKIEDWLYKKGVLASAFPILNQTTEVIRPIFLDKDLKTISDNFNKGKSLTPFKNTGLMMEGAFYTYKSQPNYKNGAVLLGDIIQKESVPPEYFIKSQDLPKWKKQKGAKNDIKINSQGIQYRYSEGAMAFPDPLDRPSRTIITGEGGSSPSRFKHVIETNEGYRRLTPIELERLNMFPDDHTYLEGITDTKRAFFMGNALVVGVIEKIGIALSQMIKNVSPIRQKK